MGGSPDPTRSLSALLSNPGLLIGLGVLLVIEVGLMVWALLDWFKRPEDAINGPKWVWIVVIMFLNMVGPIVYMMFGRKRPQVPDAPPPAPDASSRAVDALYGPGEKTGPE